MAKYLHLFNTEEEFLDVYFSESQVESFNCSLGTFVYGTYDSENDLYIWVNGEKELWTQTRDAKIENERKAYDPEDDDVVEITGVNISPGYEEPWVSYTEETEKVDYNKYDPYNGYDYVDLGLPSGTIWATCNVGAGSPEGYGAFFAWGETEPKSKYDGSTYSFSGASDFTKYNSTDGKRVLDLEDDAAHINMGGEWITPTSAHCQELFDNVTSKWTTLNGVNGVMYTSTVNSNTIFFPAGDMQVGNYREPSPTGTDVGVWLSTLYPGEVGEVEDANFLDGSVGRKIISGNRRWFGFPVRGIVPGSV